MISKNIRAFELSRKLKNKEYLRFIEAHSGLSAKLINQISYQKHPVKSLKFDGIWVSSFTTSSVRGLPDVELDCLIRRLDIIQEILAVVDIPLLVDFDTGGSIKNLKYFCKELNRIGVAGVVIEDKCGEKANSLLNDAYHELEDPSEFCKKIRISKQYCQNDEFIFIARIESLIAGYSVEHAIERAECYINSEADAILIHSKELLPEQIFSFLDKYRDIKNKKPIVCVPTTYNNVTAKELFDRGANMVVYANHMLRSSLKAMEETCTNILKFDRSKEVDDTICYPVKKLLDLIQQ